MCIRIQIPTISGIHLFNDVYQRRKRGCREQRRFPRYFDDVGIALAKSIKRVVRG
jgi:hypothetical protein